MSRKGENIFKRSDGRWEGRFIKGHINGKSLYGYVYGKSYKEARQKKFDAIKALSSTTESHRGSVTYPYLSYVANEWLKDLKQIRKPSTIVKYYNQLNNHIIPLLGSMRIDEISTDNIMLLYRILLSQKHLSPKTVSDILSTLRSIRKYAINLGYPVEFHANLGSIPSEIGEIRILTVTEEENLISYLLDHPGYTSLGILVCLFTGLRIGELCALMWQDISLENKEIYVKRTMQRLKKLEPCSDSKTYISIDKPKTQHSIRTIPIPDNIISILEQVCIPEGYFLTGSSKCYVEPRTIEYRFKSILSSCGIDNVKFHTLRHTYATRCIEAGVDIKVLSEVLGHANVNITLNRYVHPSSRFKHESINKLADLFSVR